LVRLQGVLTVAYRDMSLSFHWMANAKNGRSALNEPLLSYNRLMIGIGKAPCNGCSSGRTTNSFRSANTTPIGFAMQCAP
ncbi:MAG: hypothetical protein PVG41_16450, partial [Desulfobacteraceae bacterium]